MRILIIGGGAAGLAAAVSARKENKKAEITVVERNDRIAKKILATGNGRCNFTNANMSPTCYFGDREFAKKVLENFGTEEALRFFEDLGVMHREEEGRIYPRSNQATSISDALRLFLAENNVKIITGKKISKLKYENGKFNADSISADKVIVAVGGCAAPNFGTDGSSYNLLTDFGHGKTRTKCALVSLKTDTEKIRGLKGVKVFARAEMTVNGKVVASDTGEVLFTDYGVSGIPIMQISRFAEKGAQVRLDMMSEMSFEDLCGELRKRAALFPERDGTEIFSGLINKKLAVPVMRGGNVEKMNVKAKDFTDKNILGFAKFLKGLRLTVVGDSSFSNAQVTAGGIETAKFDPVTMESKLKKGLYAVGEALDVDALCGGYNLHFAWATGAAAGKYAAREAKK
jgi:hypothetical protein